MNQYSTNGSQWGQDSERVASVVDNGTLESEHDLDTFEPSTDAAAPGSEEESYKKHQAERLKELMFDNLAKLHSRDGTGRTYDQMYKIIKENYITHHVSTESEGRRGIEPGLTI